MFFFLENCTRHTDFDGILVDADKMALEIRKMKTLNQYSHIEFVSKKRPFDHENQDESILDAQERHKIEFCYHFVDNAINYLEKK